jgi:hypothetical protein
MVELVRVYLKMKYWKRLGAGKKGAIIGFIIGIIFAIFNDFTLWLGFILYPIDWFLFEFLNLYNVRSCGDSCWGVFLTVYRLILIILLSFLGTLIGLIWGKIKKK